ncbi:type II secretion system F family protein [Heliobacterium chlorum]|uniref:Type II secretion system F family protein n=1 Tax=Heliobacterium chlorum TaxID=2698 RepID=A0ABR7T2F6_HELCL|nr:type II secretion system F family protein [Heliobacterium chlorum]MBC9784954.1 type II secretion system F family protein [Heliobacterium chlorum]
MPLFQYEVLDSAGTINNGKLEAEDEFAAVSRLRKMGYTIIELEESRKPIFPGLLQIGKKVKVGELLLFSRQLAAMLDAGIPLTRSLFTLSAQAENPQFSQVINEVARNVEGGMSFSESLRAYPEVFSPMYADMVRAGETGGVLEEMLGRLAVQLEKDKILRDSLKSAMLYPSVILVFAVVVVLAILLFVIPIFKGFFPKDIVLPLPTKVIFSLSDSLHGYWYLYIFTVAAVLFGIQSYTSSESGKRLWDRVKFRLPVFGNLLMKATIARFARTLSTLLAGGIPVLQALDAAGPATGSYQVAKAVKDASSSIQEGKSIARPLRESGFFPPMVTDMIAVGEETGQISSLLNRLAEFYEEEVAIMSKGLTAMLEPILVMVIGVIVGSIILAVYMPIFTTITQGAR